MKKKALLVALSQKARDKEILVLDDLKLTAPKTKEAAKILKTLSGIKGFEKLLTKKENKALILLKEKTENLKHSFRNIPGILLEETRNLNLLNVLTYKYLIFPKEAVKILGQ